MTFAAWMRLGSLEALIATAAFAVFAFRMQRDRAGSRTLDQRAAISLEITERGHARRVEAISPLIVGRSTEAGLMIMDPEVSRRHALFESDGDAVFISDLQSRNGTYVNGRQIRESIEVRPGDEIDVGAARIILVGTQPWK